MRVTNPKKTLTEKTNQYMKSRECLFSTKDPRFPSTGECLIGHLEDVKQSTKVYLSLSLYLYLSLSLYLYLSLFELRMKMIVDNGFNTSYLDAQLCTMW